MSTNVSLPDFEYKMLMEAPLPIDEMRDVFFYKIGERNQPLPSQLFKFQFLESYSIGQRQKAIRAMFTLNNLASTEPIYMVLLAVTNYCHVYLNRVVNIPRPHRLQMMITGKMLLSPRGEQFPARGTAYQWIEPPPQNSWGTVCFELRNQVANIVEDLALAGRATLFSEPVHLFFMIGGQGPSPGETDLFHMPGMKDVHGEATRMLYRFFLGLSDDENGVDVTDDLIQEEAKARGLKIPLHPDYTEAGGLQGSLL